MERVVIAVSDLMFRSKIREAAGAAGVDLVVAKNLDTLVEVARSGDVSRIVVDLADQRLDALAAIRRLKAQSDSVPIVGFFPHVRVELLEAAREAGCDVVLPRSAFVARLGDVLAGSFPKGEREATS